MKQLVKQVRVAVRGCGSGADGANQADAPAARSVRKRGTEGAVMVEFLAVFFPLFSFFLGLVQLMFLQTADLITRHAAQSAVRAAVVVVPEDPNKLGGALNSATGVRKAEVARAARVPLATLGIDQGAVDVALDSASYSRDSPIKVTVTVEFPCRVPLGNLIACGGTTKTLAAEATLANQGVDYEY